MWWALIQHVPTRKNRLLNSDTAYTQSKGGQWHKKLNAQPFAVGKGIWTMEFKVVVKCKIQAQENYGMSSKTVDYM